MLFLVILICQKKFNVPVLIAEIFELNSEDFYIYILYWCVNGKFSVGVARGCRYPF